LLHGEASKKEEMKIIPGMVFGRARENAFDSKAQFRFLLHGETSEKEEMKMIPGMVFGRAREDAFDSKAQFPFFASRGNKQKSGNEDNSRNGFRESARGRF